jgi:hypothetical protein
MAEYKHGSMNIETQEKTFAGFVKYVTNGVIIILVALILWAIING